ncbi:hypothetical protein [Dietzia sp. PP-33]|jgi:hypothetical protein|uniref:Rv0361 family membrane protein n=1 Tax=Dietzia sp. PP-33 TaxID=2957500 RepID=UPI0029A2A89E|nr:hypothetical protein [Dietzia sp. PP-33]MDX2356209.1 hypothetical protein [Dietzia sp. PP-33]
MTTTSQQPPAGEPDPRDDASGHPAAGGPVDGARDGGGRRGGLRMALVAAAVVVVVVIAALVWLFAAGPMSSSARAERAVEQTLREMTDSESFVEFNSHLCAENRVPQDLVENITASGEQTGTDLDAMLRESISGSFPQDLTVTGVDIEGDVAIATVESESDGSGSEQVRMLDEDGAWKVCEPGVGMGAVPQGDQPG